MPRSPGAAPGTVDGGVVVVGGSVVGAGVVGAAVVGGGSVGAAVTGAGVVGASVGAGVVGGPVTAPGTVGGPVTGAVAGGVAGTTGTVVGGRVATTVVVVLVVEVEVDVDDDVVVVDVSPVRTEVSSARSTSTYAPTPSAVPSSTTAVAHAQPGSPRRGASGSCATRAAVSLDQGSTGASYSRGRLGLGLPRRPARIGPGIGAVVRVGRSVVGGQRGPRVVGCRIRIDRRAGWHGCGDRRRRPQRRASRSGTPSIRSARRRRTGRSRRCQEAPSGHHPS